MADVKRMKEEEFANRQWNVTRDMYKEEDWKEIKNHQKVLFLSKPMKTYNNRGFHKDLNKTGSFAAYKIDQKVDMMITTGDYFPPVIKKYRDTFYSTRNDTSGTIFSLRNKNKTELTNQNA